jgi:hypothetical protein
MAYHLLQLVLIITEGLSDDDFCLNLRAAPILLNTS